MEGNKSFVKTISFLLVGCALVIFALAPATLVPIFRISPDFLFCYIFIFLLRSPQNVPVLSIVTISLLADMVWYRPLGLATLTIVIGSECLRWAIQSKDKIYLLEELVYISLALIFTTGCQEFIKFVTSIPSLPIKDIINYILYTFSVYVLVTLSIRGLIRLKLVN